MSKSLLLFTFFFIENLFGQVYEPVIEELMNQVNLDSLTSYTRKLSGEDSVIINDTTKLITHRISSLGNDSAFEYLKNKMNNFGYITNQQVYSKIGKNLYVIKEGSLYPDKYFILCAHYDAVAEHCADDNASGVAGVLEAARVLSELKLNYSIIFAFWDEEEIGTLGSMYFAQYADSSSMQIIGVLNFEMSGYDSNNDGLMDIHTRPINQSIELASTMYIIDSVYNLPLKPVIYNPGTKASDHSRFWNHNFSAIVFSEAYYGGDFNPYYHSYYDRIEYFNLHYFHNVVKLSVGTIAVLANEGLITSVKDEHTPKVYFLSNNYPNPFNPSTIISFTIPNSDFVSLKVYDILGNEISTLVSEYKTAGTYNYQFSISNFQLSSGIYFYKLQAGSFTQSKKMILLK